MLGVLTGTYDIAALLFSPFVGYLGETRRKPLWCSCGLFVMGLGFFIFLVPHLIIGHYEAGKVLRERGWGSCLWPVRHGPRVLYLPCAIFDYLDIMRQVRY